jgi:hypothetical protein
MGMSDSQSETGNNSLWKERYEYPSSPCPMLIPSVLLFGGGKFGLNNIYMPVKCLGMIKNSIKRGDLFWVASFLRLVLLKRKENAMHMHMYVYVKGDSYPIQIGCNRLQTILHPRFKRF